MTKHTQHYWAFFSALSRKWGIFLISGLILAGLSASLVSPAGDVSQLTRECVESAAREMDVPPKLLWGILAVEGGAAGSASPNENGTFDYGPMQINTLWLPAVEKQFNATEYDLRYNACLNVRIGAWILHRELEKDPSWKGVAAYHSKTPRFAEKYLKTLKTKMATLDEDKVLARVNTGTVAHQVASKTQQKKIWSRTNPENILTQKKKEAAPAPDPGLAKMAPLPAPQDESRPMAVSRDEKKEPTPAPDPALAKKTPLPAPQDESRPMTVSREKTEEPGPQNEALTKTTTNPEEVGKPTPLNAACVEKAARDANVSLSLLLGVMATEQGAAGLMTERSNGTQDVGPMRINSSWFTRIEQELGISKNQLLYDSCLNVRAGAWVLKQSIEMNQSWAGVAAYSVRSPEQTHQYLAQLLTNIFSVDMRQILERVNCGHKVQVNSCLDGQPAIAPELSARPSSEG